MLRVNVHSVMGRNVVSVRCIHSPDFSHLLLSEAVDEGNGTLAAAVEGGAWALKELGMAIRGGRVDGTHADCWDR